MWKEDGIECDYSRSYNFLATTWENHYTVVGKNGTKAGDGGNGGKQGNPGLAGQILLFGLDQTPDLSIYQKEGNAIDLIKFLQSKFHD